MDKIKKIFAHKIFKIIWWAFLVLAGLFIILVIVRIFHLVNQDKINVEVEKIHNTRLTMDDVMGINLPPDPGALADRTVEGVDANENGIRDDVELAIFKEYPNSAKTRAVLLQYALALQLEVIQPIINIDTVTAVAERTSSGYYCIGEITSRDNMEKFIEIGNELHNFIENKQLDTETREIAQKDFYRDNLGSYELPSECDINIASLPN